MTAKKLVLALDSGSQSSRALLFTAAGEVVGKGARQHQPMRYPQAGAVEQDPGDIWQSVCGATRDCLAAWGGDPAAVAGASLTTQRSTIIPTADDGEPLADAISWLDRRSAGIDSEPSALLRTVLRILGKDSMVPRLLGKSWPRQLRERSPELVARMRWLATVESWLHHRLVGRMAMGPGGVAGAWPFDVKRRAWSNLSLLYSVLGYRRRWLPELVEAGQLVGRLTEAAAAATGLPAGLPLFACGGDKQAEGLGAGVCTDRTGLAAVSLGTGSSIALPWPRAVESPRYTWLCMAASQADSWWLEYLLFRGMWTAAWFARELARDLQPAAEAGDTSVEALLCDEAAEVPAGSDGLVTLPRWSPTLQHPLETGICIGLRETLSRGHLFRSLLEGIAFDLRRGREILERASHSTITEASVGGGGSRSTLVVQILADVLNLPVRRPESEELAARGAAIVAAVGSGLHPSAAAAVDAMVPAAPLVLPDRARAEAYDRLYRRVYLPGLDLGVRISSHLAEARSFFDG